jgi:hypothetical protein
MTKSYRDNAGNYLGSFSAPAVDGTEQDHPDVPPGAIETPSAPEDARQKWDGTKWGPKPAPDDARFEAEAAAIEAATDLDTVKANVAAALRKL